MGQIAPILDRMAQIAQRLRDARHAVGGGAHQAAGALLAGIDRRADQDAMGHASSPLRASSLRLAAESSAIIVVPRNRLRKTAGKTSIMDETDQRLIAELRRDGRASLSDLADRLGLSRATVRARMERLAAKGEIAGFTVLTRGDITASPVRGLMMIGIEGRGTERDHGPPVGPARRSGGSHHKRQVGSDRGNRHDHTGRTG